MTENIPEYNVQLRQGYDWWVSLSYTDPLKVAIPFTGFTLSWTFIVDDVTYTLTDGDGLEVDYGAGTLVASLTRDQTADLDIGIGKHYFDLVDSMDRRTAWFAGGISVSGV